jgi:hypothetical protein
MWDTVTIKLCEESNRMEDDYIWWTGSRGASGYGLSKCSTLELKKIMENFAHDSGSLLITKTVMEMKSGTLKFRTVQIYQIFSDQEHTNNQLVTWHVQIITSSCLSALMFLAIFLYLEKNPAAVNV